MFLESRWRHPEPQVSLAAVSSRCTELPAGPGSKLHSHCGPGPQSPSELPGLGSADPTGCPATEEEGREWVGEHTGELAALPLACAHLFFFFF